jgi:tetratricopeptide (TPR) repeat protein
MNEPHRNQDMAARCHGPNRPRSPWPFVLRLLNAAVVVAGGHATGWAVEQPLDRVRLMNGTELRGEIIDASPNALDLQAHQADGGLTTTKVPIETIREVRFAGEPDGLQIARGLLARKDAVAALEELGKITSDELATADEEVREELAYVRSAATARRALATGENLAAGEKAVSEFLSKQQRSLHFYAMQELLGDLLAAQGKPSEAAAAYGALDTGPPAIAVRAATLKADLLFLQGKYAEAQREYESAAKSASGIGGPSGERSAWQSDLGRARCLTRQGRPDEAMSVVTGLLAATDRDNASLAKAYNVLGTAQRAAAGDPRDALISFLTVDLVHNDEPDDHAEALFNLVELWEKANHPERAREARQALETTYPASPWTKKLAPAKAS